MYVPIILGSDKTTVSVATGQNDYHPVYLSIGNVSNAVRRAHRNAVTVVAFLAIPRSAFSSLPLVFSFNTVLAQLKRSRRNRRASDAFVENFNMFRLQKSSSHLSQACANLKYACVRTSITSGASMGLAHSLSTTPIRCIILVLCKDGVQSELDLHYLFLCQFS